MTLETQRTGAARPDPGPSTPPGLVAEDRAAPDAPGMPGLEFRVEEESPARRTVALTIPARLFEEEVQEELRQFRKKVRLRGFRKGRAPRERIEGIYGEEASDRAAGRLLARASRETLAALDLRPIGDPEITVQDQVRGRALTGRLVLSVWPSIGKIDFDGIEASARESSVTEADIGETLEALRREKAHPQPIGEREIRDDDIVVGDLQETDAASPDESPRLTEAVALRVGSGAYHEALHEALQGASAGDTVVATAHFGAESPDPERAGRTIRASYTIREATTPVLPPLDDDFARSVGAASLLALRGDIRDRLRQHAREEDRRALEDELLRALLERNPIEAPAPLVEQDLAARVRALVAEMVQRGLTPELAQERIQRDLPALRAGCRKTVAATMLLDALAAQEKIKTSEEALEERIRQEAEARDKSPVALRATLEKDGALDRIRTRMQREAVVAFLREHAEIAKREGNEPT